MRLRDLLPLLRDAAYAMFAARFVELQPRPIPVRRR